MKIWCEKCNGGHKTGNSFSGYRPCPECDGEGYTEPEEFDELERLARIGVATEKAFNMPKFAMIFDDSQSNDGVTDISVIEELIQWHDELKVKEDKK